MEFIGREEETSLFNEFFSKDRASIITVYGRRRVGKTALIETFLRTKRFIKLEGKQNQSKEAQIEHVLFTLSKVFKEPFLHRVKLTSWTEVFDLIATRTQKGEWVLYLEEVQWLSCYGDELISDLKEVWDNQFSKNKKFRLVLCGSAPSFMVAKVIRSKALHNRSLYSLPLGQFSLVETHKFLGLRKSKIEVMDAYLSVGGIPEYLHYLRGESSIYLGLLKNSFVRGSFFADEFEKIFTSSLSENVHYKKVIEFLSKRKFATRDEILTHLKLETGGTISMILEDLECCEFIEGIVPYDAPTKGRLKRYTIRDNYLQFYYKFIAPRKRSLLPSASSGLTKMIPIETYRQWLGYSFERWCRSNHLLIAKALGFQDVEYQSGAYFNRELLGSGFQIDLIFKRKDNVLSVCEIKYNLGTLTTSLVTEFERKIERLPHGKRQTIQRVLITAGSYSPKLKNHFDRIVTLEDLT